MKVQLHKTVLGLAMSLLAVSAEGDAQTSVTGRAGAQVAASDTTRLAGVVPVADHHAHLNSPVNVAVDPPLPTVKLPKDLQQLLSRRVALWRSLDSLPALYTADAIAFGPRGNKWVTGPDHVARQVGWLSGNIYTAYALTPVKYRLTGATASIWGYYRDKDENGRVLAGFHLDLVRGADNRWRISSEVPVFQAPRPGRLFTADSLIAQLDRAGIKKAVVLSQAYMFDGLLERDGDDSANVRAENDWTVSEVQRFPNRLVAFCSFNPVRTHALPELERCAKLPGMRGLKLHLGTSPVDLDNPEDVAKTRKIFEAANRLRLPIVVHLAASPEWGRRQAEIFVTQLVAAAPDVQVVVAHLWGGAVYIDDVLSYFATTVASGQPAAKNLYFDLTQAARVAAGNQKTLALIAQHMREIGFNRLYWGGDMPFAPGLPPKELWEEFRATMPLTPTEFAAVAQNVAPWVP